MVSINKLINLGIIAAVVGGFIYLGGAKGIGERLGGGITQFGQSFAGSIKFPEIKFPTLGLPDLSAEKNEGIGPYEKAVMEAGGEENLTSEEKRNIAKSLLTPEELEGSAIAKEFSTALSYGDITQEFAKKYSYVAPKKGTLDVSKAFGSFYNISDSDYKARQASNFGGYGSAVNQQTALAKAIQESAAKYPEWFN